MISRFQLELGAPHITPTLDVRPSFGLMTLPAIEMPARTAEHVIAGRI